MKLFIHATNISHGGGKSLLVDLLNALTEEYDVVLQLDIRMKVLGKIWPSQIVRRVKPTIVHRLYAEWWLARQVSKCDLAICFGSLPPLLKLKGHVIVFVQNRYLIEKKCLTGFPLKTRLRLIFERIWFALTASNVDEFIVQTPAMKMALLSSGLTKNRPIHIRPFVMSSVGYRRTSNYPKGKGENIKYDFIYVASGDPHKNHRQLVEAWCFLAEQDIFPSLCITLDTFVSRGLCDWIEEKKHSHKLNLINIGCVPHNQVLELYTKVGALIFPSRFESFGLPLIEACQANLPVLAAELDYVRDVLDPVETFDPNSPVSIARAVKRYLGKEENPLPLTDAEKFLHLLFK